MFCECRAVNLFSVNQFAYFVRPTAQKTDSTYNNMIERKTVNSYNEERGTCLLTC